MIIVDGSRIKFNELYLVLVFAWLNKMSYGRKKKILWLMKFQVLQFGFEFQVLEFGFGLWIWGLGLIFKFEFGDWIPSAGIWDLGLSLKFWVLKLQSFFLSWHIQRIQMMIFLKQKFDLKIFSFVNQKKKTNQKKQNKTAKYNSKCSSIKSWNW